MQGRESGGSRAGLFFTITLDIQFLLGILLLLTSNAFGNMGETMKDATARFYADHILTKVPGLRDTIVEGGDSVSGLALDAF